jgi:tetratricopeptide (TPR) repeat protein
VSASAAPADARALGRRLALPAAGAQALTTLAIGAVLAAIALEANGGLQLGPLTRVEVGVDLGAGVLGAAAVVAGGHTRRLWGATTLACLAALTALTALSIIWAVEPSDAWIEANRTLCYLATFGAAIALVRLAPQRWPSVLGGIIVAAVVVCGYALLTKVFPASLNADEVYARLREPFGYWNAVGLMAALAGPPCLWLGARRTGHALLSALAYPVLGLLIACLLLAYSRGSVLALAIGCIAWFAVVPLRLRGVAVLGVSALGGGLVAGWAFSMDALSEDRVPLDARTTAGHELGVLLLAMALVLLAAGLAVGFLSARRPPSPGARRQAGVGALCAVALVPVAFVAVLAVSDRGLGGSVSKGWKDLTDPNAATPANAPDRLTAVGSVRARYWNEALKIFRDHKAVGVGAGGYATVRPRYRHDTLQVRHAHGYGVQTLADLGLVGAAVSLALLAAWLTAAGRTLMLWGPGRRRRWTPERVGLATMAASVVVFGVHSLVDWTWFVPGTAVIALLCAGWVAGRGPADEPVRRRRGLATAPWRLALAAAAIAVACLAAWTSWQPLRSVDAGNDALALAEGGHVTAARAASDRADKLDPLSVDPLFERAAVEQQAGRPDAARAALESAVHRQPGNPATWLSLAQFEVDQGKRKRALAALGPALYLDPRSPSAQQTYLDASRLGS